MTKALLFLLMLVIASTAFPQGDAPTLVKGQGSSTKYVGATVQVPNKQATKINSSTVHLELNNKNLLYNPSFETGFSGGTSGWTDAGTTALSFNASYPTDGNYAGWYMLSASGMDLSQTSTAYANAFADGTTQCLAMAKIKTDTPITFCPIVNSTKQTSICLTTQSDAKYHLYKIPFICGGTNNGVSFVSGTNVVGNVYIDEVFAGPVDLKVDTNNISNPVSYTPTVTTASGTMTNYTATGDWMRVGSRMRLTGKITFSNLSGAFDNISISIPSGYTVDTSAMKNSNLAGSTMALDFGVRLYPGGGVECGSTTCTIYGAVTDTHIGNQPLKNIAYNNTYPFTFNANDSVQWEIEVPIVDWASSGSIYSSTNADTDWQACTFASTSWQGLGTVTNNLECKRRGSDLLMRGFFTLGTVSGSQAQMPLPLLNGNQLSINKGGFNGTVITQNTTANKPKTYTVFPTSIPQSFLNFGIAEYSLVNSSAAAINGNTSFVNGDILVLNGELVIPIQGWENSNIIIGQFNGLESCTDTYQCTDSFSAYVDNTGVVSQENVEWITGNASITDGSLFQINLASGLKGGGQNLSNPMNCEVTPYATDSSTAQAKIDTFTSSTVKVRTGYSTSTSTMTKQPYHFFISCQKQGADFIGKTAKAVASDQNVRSIGSVGVDIQSVYFGGNADCSATCTSGNCTICNRVGTKITSVTWFSAGAYRLNGIDGTKYNCSGTGYSNTSFWQSMAHDRPVSTSSYAHMSTGSTSSSTPVNTGYNSVTCIGIP